MRVEATDADTGLNGQLKYSIVRGNSEPGAFDIDSITGDIRIAQPLDYENIKVYNLVVKVEDSGFTSRSATSTVKIVLQARFIAFMSLFVSIGTIIINKP